MPAYCAAAFAANTVDEATMVDYVGDREKSRAAHGAESKELASALREIFGNPFRPVATDPAWPLWHDGIIAKMATAIPAIRIANLDDFPRIAAPS